MTEEHHDSREGIDGKSEFLNTCVGRITKCDVSLDRPRRQGQVDTKYHQELNSLPPLLLLNSLPLTHSCYSTLFHHSCYGLVAVHLDIVIIIPTISHVLIIHTRL